MTRTMTMRAAVVRDKRLIVADVPVPEPGPGEVLVKSLACGICGSNLHALKHADLFASAYRRADGAPLVTGKVGVAGVAGAFEDLASPERHAKILVEPWREGD